MAITVTFSFDEETVARLESLSNTRGETKSAILRGLVAKEYALRSPVTIVSVETVQGNHSVFGADKPAGEPE